MEKFQAVRKSGKLWRKETILAQVWCILPDNSDPSSDLIVRALVLQLAALMWIQIELFCYSQTSCYQLVLPLLSASELTFFPVKFLAEPRRAVWETARLHHSQKRYPQFIAKSQDLISRDVALPVWLGTLQGYQINKHPLSNWNAQSPILCVCLSHSFPCSSETI